MEGGPKETLKLRVNITSDSLALDERRINDIFVSTIGPPIIGRKVPHYKNINVITSSQ